MVDDCYIIPKCLWGSLPLVSHAYKGYFYAGYLPLHLDFMKPLKLKKKTMSSNIQHPIGNYERKPRLFQMMLVTHKILISSFCTKTNLRLQYSMVYIHVAIYW